MIHTARPKFSLFAFGWFCLCAFVALGGERGNPKLPIDSLPEKIDIDQVPDSISLQRSIPSDNALTVEKVSLGRKLFFDPILSGDRTVSCASCHQPEHGFASPDKKAVGIDGQIGERNAPTVLNRAYGKHFFWDGRASSLEEQALKPIENAKELGSSVNEVIDRLRNDQAYVDRFRKAFSDSASDSIDAVVSAQNLAKSLAAFQRTLLIGDSPVDRFQGGEFSALTVMQKKGLWIFESRGG